MKTMTNYSVALMIYFLTFTSGFLYSACASVAVVAVAVESVPRETCTFEGMVGNFPRALNRVRKGLAEASERLKAGKDLNGLFFRRLILLGGYQGVGKKDIARKIAAEASTKIFEFHGSELKYPWQIHKKFEMVKQWTEEHNQMAVILIKDIDLSVNFWKEVAARYQVRKSICQGSTSESAKATRLYEDSLNYHERVACVWSSVFNKVSDNERIVLIATTKSSEAVDEGPLVRLKHVAIPLPRPALRKKFIRQYMKQHGRTLEWNLEEALVERCDLLSIGEIKEVLSWAIMYADACDRELTEKDVEEAVAKFRPIIKFAPMVCDADSVSTLCAADIMPVIQVADKQVSLDADFRRFWRGIGAATAVTSLALGTFFIRWLSSDTDSQRVKGASETLSIGSKSKRRGNLIGARSN